MAKYSSSSIDAAVHVLQRVLVEQLDEISQHAPGASLGLVVLVVGGHAVEVLPHVAVAVDHVVAGEVVLLQQSLEVGRAEESSQAGHLAPHELVRDGGEAAGERHEIVHVVGLPEVADDLRRSSRA